MLISGRLRRCSDADGSSPSQRCNRHTFCLVDLTANRGEHSGSSSPGQESEKGEELVCRVVFSGVQALNLDINHNIEIVPAPVQTLEGLEGIEDRQE
jgi:hypothetical protein